MFQMSFLLSKALLCCLAPSSACIPRGLDYVLCGFINRTGDPFFSFLRSCVLLASPAASSGQKNGVLLEFQLPVGLLC